MAVGKGPPGSLGEGEEETEGRAPLGVFKSGVSNLEKAGVESDFLPGPRLGLSETWFPDMETASLPEFDITIYYLF